MTVDLPDNIIEPPGEDEQSGPQDAFDELAAETRRPELLLWLDLETAGYMPAPDPVTDTVLECAWMITYREPPTNLRFRQPTSGHWAIPETLDLTDWQLTPLRSRLCSIGPGEGSWPHARIPDVADRWSQLSPPMPRKVIDMHDDSGLTDDHLAAQDGGRIIDHPAILARLIIDDMQAATARVRREHEFEEYASDPYLYIAGDGVGHYDQPLLRRDQFGPLSTSWHYRPEDVSHALHTLAPVRHPVQLICAGKPAQDYGRVLAEGLDVDPRIDLGGWQGRDTMHAWVDADKVAHRAAADVFRSVMAYLAARDIVGSRLITRQY